MNVAATPVSRGKGYPTRGPKITGRRYGLITSALVPPTVALADKTNVCPLNVKEPPPTVSPALNVCSPVHVGTIACDNEGALSLVIHVAAVPLTAVSPMVAVGLCDPAEPAPV